MNVKVYLSLIVVLTLVLSCGNLKKDPESLAIRHCSSCHAFPDPSMLDKKTWETGVFPEMAFRMGLDVSRLPQTNELELHEILKALPPTPLVTQHEWESILKYYTQFAPDSLIQSDKTYPTLKQQFIPAIVSLPVRTNTLLTMVKFDAFSKTIFVGNRNGKLYELESSFELKDSLKLTSPPSDILFHQNENYFLSCMGVMDPNDQAAGSVISFAFNDTAPPLTLIDSLKRPVHLQESDLNNDGQQDIIVSNFGNFTGGLFAYEQRDGKYHKHAIHNFPGNRKTVVRDFNNDGMPDILTLLSQGDERMALFTNRGNFRFSFQVLLRFPPVYGSSFFEIYDFNNDGAFDILYTNGDNADYSSILKPYHGVRIFLNNGKNEFRESWFHPMHGASMAQAADFDKDGDLDIAAISFFPDFKKHPEHSFIYFENDNNNFRPHVTALAASSRWITMESGDIDGDEDIDLILGALTFPNGVPDSLFQIWKEKDASLLVLKNNIR